MSFRRSLSSNQKFSLIVASIALVLAAETAGLFVLTQHHPAPTESAPANSTAPLLTKPSDSDPAAIIASNPTGAPVFTAPGANPTPKHDIRDNAIADLHGQGGLVSPDDAGTLLNNTGSASIVPAPSGAARGKNDLSGKATSQEAPEKAKAREAFARGVEALKRNDNRAAIDAFERVVALVPDNLPSHLNLASLYLSTRQPKQALPHLQKAAKIDPKSAAVRFNIARTLLALGRTTDALGALKATVHLAPAERDGHLLLAQVLLQTRRPKDAYVQWKILAQRDKRDIEAHVMAASLANDALNRPKDAEKWLRISIEATPRSPQPALMLGRLLLGQGRFKEAAAMLTTATRARPDVFEFYPLLANARTATGDASGAVAALNSAISRLPMGKTADEKARIAFAEGGLRITLGQTLGNAKKIKPALAEFQKAAKLRPNDPQPRSLGAIAALQLKDEAAATRLLQAALRLDPKRIGDRKVLAQLYIDARRWKDADAQLALYARTRPKDVQVLLLWAQVARAGKDAKREKQVVRQLTEVAPTNPLGWAQLGLLQRESGQRKAALATFTRLAALVPRDPSPPFEMARLQTELGDFDGAFQSWQKVVRNKPDYAPAYSSLLQAGDEAKARGAARSFLVRQLSGRTENVNAIKEILGFYDAKKRPDEAKAFLSDLLARNPKFIAAKAALDSFGSGKPDAGKSDADKPTATTPAKPPSDDSTPETGKPE